MSRPFALSLLCSLLLTLPGISWAGAVMVPCDRPFVFPRAAVNVVVLPFTLPPQLRRFSQTGARLGMLVQKEVLLSIAKFESVGAIHLSEESPSHPCKAEQVRAQLLGEVPGAANNVERGRALVLVWGRIFESEKQLFIQPYVQFLRRGVTEQVRQDIGGKKFVGELSAQGFMGLQRRMSLEDLARIEQLARRAGTLYAEPNEQSSKTELPLEVPFYYYVIDVKGDWMRVVPFAPDRVPYGGQVINEESREARWMKARSEGSDFSLRRFLPELAFVEGVSGFLSARVAQDMPSGRKPERIDVLSKMADRSLAEYREAFARNQVVTQAGEAGSEQSLALAVPLQVQGMMRLLPASPNLQALREAQALFADSTRLLPASADARNLNVMAQLLLAYRDTERAMSGESATSSLLAAVGLEPDNRLVLANLASAYEIVTGPKENQPQSWPPITPEQRATAVERLQSVREALAPQ